MIRTITEMHDLARTMWNATSEAEYDAAYIALRESCDAGEAAGLLSPNYFVRVMSYTAPSNDEPTEEEIAYYDWQWALNCR